MLDLYQYITPEDDAKIKAYVTKYAIYDEGYIGNKDYLSYWCKNKKKLFHLLGGQLIKKIPFSYEKDKTQIEMELKNLYHNCDFFYLYSRFFYNKINEIKDLSQIFLLPCLITNEVNVRIKYKALNKNQTLQISPGMKPMKAILKTLKYFDAHEELLNAFEDFRIKHSQIFNEKTIKGSLCISIHPLDFMTMSDNNSNWSSCMSWNDHGCYQTGTVEMMNSNNVICAYLEGTTPYTFDQENDLTWNNKKWRQLFICTKDIIVSGKAYPYHNDDLSLKVLECLRELAKKNWNQTYKYGIEKYQDMKHFYYYDQICKIQDWIADRQTTKHNIIFHSNGMYNDMFNDHGQPYWCVRNKVKRNRIITFSGETMCACCGGSVIEKNENVYYDFPSEDIYNERYLDVDKLVCFDCRHDLHLDCYNCDNPHNQKTYEINDHYYCADCIDQCIRLCPDCGKPFDTRFNYEKFYVRYQDKKYYLKDLYRLIDCDIFFICSNCLSKRTDIITIPIEYSSVDAIRCANISTLKNIYNKEDDFIQKHLFANLKKF